MKKAYLIIVFIMLLKPVFPVFEYVYNYDYITTVLCENLDKPELECHGKCHLMKEMGKSVDTENPFSTAKKLSQPPVDIAFISTLTTDSIPYFDSWEAPTLDLCSPNNYTFLWVSGVFEPPSLRT
ncbi:hypothetical protein [Flavobacterium sp. JP2137]|uniref:hypothetical protein n=1 Tax=Flavobacterium sp. JP2137 TaxID=3414510 RepID=UPI003D300C77